MGNALINAGGLDGATGWLAVAGSVSVDEAVYGAPGRAVFVGSGTVVSSPVAVQAGQALEVYARIADGGGAVPALNILVGGQSVPVPLVTRAQGAPARGIAARFNWFSGRVVMPVSGNAQFGASSANQTLVMKPYMGLATGYGRPTVWDPGSHIAVDLQRPVWPSILPPFRADSLPQPVANASGFATDTNIQITRDLYSKLQYDYRGQMRLDADQMDALDQFFAVNRSTFYVLDALTDRLCVANWLPDGAPKPTANAGPWTIVEVGLHLVVA